MKVRPINDWILIELKPLETQVGSIIVPNGVYFRKATVLATGPGKLLENGVRKPTGVVPGELVLLPRAYAEVSQGRLLLQELGDNQLLVKPEDILLVFDEDVVVQ